MTIMVVQISRPSSNLGGVSDEFDVLVLNLAGVQVAQISLEEPQFMGRFFRL